MIITNQQKIYLHFICWCGLGQATASYSWLLQCVWLNVKHSVSVRVCVFVPMCRQSLCWCEKRACTCNRLCPLYSGAHGASHAHGVYRPDTRASATCATPRSHTHIYAHLADFWKTRTQVHTDTRNTHKIPARNTLLPHTITALIKPSHAAPSAPTSLAPLSHPSLSTGRSLPSRGRGR